MVQALASGELEPLPGWGGADSSSMDLVAWFAPPPWHPLLGSQALPLNQRIFNGGERLGYLGFVLLVFGIMGAVLVLRRRRLHWPVLAAVFGVLAMGPFLQVMGKSGSVFTMLGRQFTVPLPYLALHYVPVLNGLRIPSRFSVVTALALTVLAAITLTNVVAHRAARLAPVLAAGLLVVLIVDFFPNRAYQPVSPATTPSVYTAIAERPGRRAVLEVPIQWRDGFGIVGGPDEHFEFLRYATVHRKPVVNGMVARYPEPRMRRLQEIPVYREVLALQGELGYDDPPSFTTSDLEALGIGYIVYHRDIPRPLVLAYVETLGLPVLADDGTNIVYEVPGG
jgi:hypothetical protein